MSDAWKIIGLTALIVLTEGSRIISLVLSIYNTIRLDKLLKEKEEN